jgi:predicted TIM-barrel fold metal-dependent hydrolase
MIFSDLNIHLPEVDEPALMLREELSLSGSILISSLQRTLSSCSKGMAKSNIMIFNQYISHEDIEELVSLAKSYSLPSTYLTLLASPYRIKSLNELGELADAGISAIKFHSYQQKIDAPSFSHFIRLAAWAADLGLPICIDASYGSLGMYKYDNLRLVASIAEVVSNVPIIVLHSGGCRCIEAMLLAEAADNIFLETSFTLPYYSDSAISADLAFVYKKIGYHRVVYASDHPYVSQDTALKVALEFCFTHKLTSSEQHWLFTGSFDRIFA